MSIFSELDSERILLQNKHFFLIEDAYPVSAGHVLIISNTEVADFFDLPAEAQDALPEAIRRAQQWIELHHNPDGYNIGMNCGEAAGQTVMHFHCHIIPRYKGDTPNPKGGIRHCVKGKGDYTSWKRR